jgi:hypothetical protein
VASRNHSSNTFRNNTLPASSTAKEVCDINRIDVLDDVLKEWKNTPDYGTYAVNTMDWQVKLGMTVAGMAYNYVARHGHLDVGFEGELQRRMIADPPFARPKNISAGTCSVPHVCTEAKDPASNAMTGRLARDSNLLIGCGESDVP